MRAAFLHGIRDLRLGDLPEPRPGPDEILLRIRAVGLCGSDLHYYADGGTDERGLPEPLVLGHELAGEVIDERAADFGLRPGALVAVDPARPCGRCEWCLRAEPNLCPHQVFSGSPPAHHGGLCERLVAPRANLFPVPASFTPSVTAVLELLGVAVHACQLAAVRPGETVAVVGAGPLGLLLVQLARLAGASRIWAVDPLEYRAARARDLGADDAGTEAASLEAWTSGRGVDLVLEATNTAAGPRAAAGIARIGGRVVLAGIPAGDRLTFPASVLRRKQLNLQLVRRMGHVYPRAIGLVEEGKVDVGAVITHTFPLHRAADAFELLASRGDGVLKCVVEV
ncbi:MAG: alcohol dehydrogenase catalytic domain-containing protein [Gemmatimonadota bacterium]